MTDKTVVVKDPTDTITDGTGWGREGDGIGIKHLSGSMTIGGDGEGGKHLSDPHNPCWPTGGGSSNIGGGTGGSGVKSLSDPWVIKAEKQVVIGGDHDINGNNHYDASGGWDAKPITGDVFPCGRIPVLWKGDSGSVIIRHEVPKNGDDQYDASGDGLLIDADDLMGKDGNQESIILKVGPIFWKGGDQLGIILKVGPVDPGPGYIDGGDSGYISGDDPTWDIQAGQDRIGSTEYGGRTSEDISDGGEGLDHEWYIDGDFYIEKDFGVRGHTNSFSGDWGL